MRLVASLALPSVLLLACQLAATGTSPILRAMAADDLMAPLGLPLMLSRFMPQLLAPL